MQKLGSLAKGIKAEKSVTVAGNTVTVRCVTRVNESSARVLNERIFDFSALSRAEIIELAIPEVVIRQQATDRREGKIASKKSITLPFPERKRVASPKIGTFQCAEAAMAALPPDQLEVFKKRLLEKMEKK